MIKKERKFVVGDKIHFFNKEIISIGTIIGFKRDKMYVELDDGGARRIKIDQIINRDRYE